MPRGAGGSTVSNESVESVRFDDDVGGGVVMGFLLVGSDAGCGRLGALRASLSKQSVAARREATQVIVDGHRFGEGDDNEVSAVFVHLPTFGVGEGIFQCHAQQTVFRTVDFVEDRTVQTELGYYGVVGDGIESPGVEEGDGAGEDFLLVELSWPSRTFKNKRTRTRCL